jgi:hypothetical protein
MTSPRIRAFACWKTSVSLREPTTWWTLTPGVSALTASARPLRKVCLRTAPTLNLATPRAIALGIRRQSPEVDSRLATYQSVDVTDGHG